MMSWDTGTTSVMWRDMGRDQYRDAMGHGNDFSDEVRRADDTSNSMHSTAGPGNDINNVTVHRNDISKT